MSRILALSDGVFGFGITFLVVTLALPQVLGSRPPSLVGYLGMIEPQLVAYFVSFFIIASWWVGHHQIFSSIVRYDRPLIQLNNLFLLTIAITPLLVGILFTYGPSHEVGPSSLSARLAVSLYAAVEVVAALILLAIWRHATRGRRLVDRALSDAWIHASERRLLTLLGVFLASIAIAFVSPFIAELSWFALAVAGRRPPRRARGPGSARRAARFSVPPPG